MRDRWEHRHHVKAAKADPDDDGVKNVGEFRNGTQPRDADSDDDGVNDGDDDANDDGIDDGDEQAGVIESFDSATGVLTLTLVNGDSLRGTVNGDTEIECEAPATIRHDGSGDDGSGDDNSGPGSGDDDETEVGDDNSGPGSVNSGDDEGENHDAGDDHGDDDDQGEDEQECSTDALVPGTTVREAELKATSSGAIFDEIELGGMASA